MTNPMKPFELPDEPDRLAYYKTTYEGPLGPHTSYQSSPVPRGMFAYSQAGVGPLEPLGIALFVLCALVARAKYRKAGKQARRKARRRY